VAEPIRNYTPRRDVREELRRKVEEAPIEHAQAVLSAYQLLQEAQDHGVLDTLRGGIGAGETLIGTVSEYANTPEGICLLRNGLAAARLLGEMDPALLDGLAKALSQHRHSRQENDAPPSLWRILQRLTNRDSRRTLGLLAGVTESFGRARERGDQPMGKGNMRVPAIVPVIAVSAIAVVVSYWLGRNS